MIQTRRKVNAITDLDMRAVIQVTNSRLGKLWFCSSSSDVNQHRGPECIFERTLNLKGKSSETSSRNCSGAAQAVCNGPWAAKNSSSRSLSCCRISLSTGQKNSHMNEPEHSTFFSTSRAAASISIFCGLKQSLPFLELPSILDKQFLTVETQCYNSWKISYRNSLVLVYFKPVF